MNEPVKQEEEEEEEEEGEGGDGGEGGEGEEEEEANGDGGESSAAGEKSVAANGASPSVAEEGAASSKGKRKGRPPSKTRAGGAAADDDEEDGEEEEEVAEQATTAKELANAEHLTCAVCLGGGDEDHLLICDGCSSTTAQHTYCAKPPLEAVPDGEWYCDVCRLKAQCIDQAPNQELRITTGVLLELRKPTHGIGDLWRFKVPLARTSSQLMLHIGSFVEAIDRAKLKPLIDEFTAQNRQELKARRESDAFEQAKSKEEKKEQREIQHVMESLLKQVEKQVVREEKQEARDAKRQEEERAKREAQEEKEAARKAARRSVPHWRRRGQC